MIKAVFPGFLTLALLTFCTAATFGQTTAPISGSTQLGTFTVTSFYGNDDPNLGDTDEKESHIEFIGWLTPGNETVFTMNVNSVEFNESCSWAETIDLDALIHEWAKDGLARAVQLGYISGSSSCPPSSSVIVYYPTCVNRNTSGDCPVFTAASPTSFSSSAYNVCTSSGSLSITLVSVACGAGSCGTGYESTCP